MGSFFDRLLTVVVTATITSAGWIVFGGSLTGTDPPPQPIASPQSSASPQLQVSGASPPSPAPIPAGDWQIPVQGVAASELVDTFADRRDQGLRPHDAIDIPAPAGTPVLAAAAGTVEKLFQSKAGGTTIYIRPADRNWIHYYAHLQSYAPGLAEGQQVRQGQQLGTVGSTGNADPAAPHLHFAILQVAPTSRWSDPGTAINPYPLLTRK
ncbi:MAG: M23 family metallopeptidase [Croceibacterium sp.]